MSVELLREALSYAEKNNYPIILTLNTPGGSLDATFKIISLIEGSNVPVIGYVYPRGATAWSAGTYIL
ncbi:nodulation protein NfeD, partial [Candidatus Bathyarchaeota archaeon]